MIKETIKNYLRVYGKRLKSLFSSLPGHNLVYSESDGLSDWLD